MIKAALATLVLGRGSSPLGLATVLPRSMARGARTPRRRRRRDLEALRGALLGNGARRRDDCRG